MPDSMIIDEQFGFGFSAADCRLRQDGAGSRQIAWLLSGEKKSIKWGSVGWGPNMHG